MFKKIIKTIVQFIPVVALVTGCGGGGDESTPPPPPATPAVTTPVTTMPSTTPSTTPTTPTTPSSGKLFTTGWSTSKSVDPNNSLIWSVLTVGDNGTVLGAWYTQTGVVTGSKTATASSWSIGSNILPTGYSSPYQPLYRYRSKPIAMGAYNDKAVLAFAANKGSTPVMMVTARVAGIWQAPEEVALPVTNGDVKIDVNGSGTAAVAWCAQTGKVQMVVVSNTGAKKLYPDVQKCKSPNGFEASTVHLVQAANDDVTIYSIDEFADTLKPTVTRKAITERVFTASTQTWGNPSRITSEEAGNSLSGDFAFAISNDRNIRLLAWTQNNDNLNRDIVSKLRVAGVWQSDVPVTTRKDKKYDSPVVAVNNTGYALIAFNDASAVNGEMSHIMASSRKPGYGWATPAVVQQFGFMPPDLTIDEVGNGAIAFIDLSSVRLASINAFGAYSASINMTPSSSHAGENNFRFGKSPTGNNYLLYWMFRDGPGYATRSAQ